MKLCILCTLLNHFSLQVVIRPSLLCMKKKENVHAILFESDDEVEEGIYDTSDE